MLGASHEPRDPNDPPADIGGALLSGAVQGAYNHIVNHQMLLWLIEAAGVDKKLV